jgi:hypothetical protein
MTPLLLSVPIVKLSGTQEDDMTRYEYKVVECYSDGLNGDRSKVAKVNGVKVTYPRQETTWDYLNQQGYEGWEVVAGTVSERITTYILKRLIPGEVSS